jgi:hypothetical protein
MDLKEKLSFSLPLRMVSNLESTNFGLDVTGTYQLLANMDDIKLIGDDLRLIEKYADVLLNVCLDTGLIENT